MSEHETQNPREIFAEQLNHYMKLNGVIQSDIVAKFGLTASTVSDWCNGKKYPRVDKIQMLADYFGILKSDLTEKTSININTNKYPSPQITSDYTTFPVIGNVAAGYEHIAVEDWGGDVIDIPNSFLKGRQISDFFVLCVDGNSMFPTFQDGDKVLILKQPTLNYSGQVGAVIYDDEYATLKRVEYKQGEDWLNLVPINPTYPSKRVDGEDLEHCKIIGIPRLLIREIEN